MHSTKWRIPYAYTAQRNYNIKKHINFSLYNKVTYEQIHSHMNSMYDYDEPTRMTLLQLNKQLFEEEGIGNNIVENVNDDYSNLDVYIDSNGIPDFSRHRDGSMNFGYTPEEKSHYTPYIPPTEDDIFNEAFPSRIPSDVEQFVSEDTEEPEEGYIKYHNNHVDFSKLYHNIYDKLSNVKDANQTIDFPFKRRMTIGLNIYDNIYLPGGIVGTYSRDSNNILNSSFASGRYPTASESNWSLGRIIPKKKSTPYNWSTANRLVNTKRTFGYSNSLYTTLIDKYGKQKADRILYNARSLDISPSDIIKQSIIDANKLEEYSARKLEENNRIFSSASAALYSSTPPITLFSNIDNAEAIKQYNDTHVLRYPMLSSLVEKGVTENKGWSAPIVIFDTETTSLKSSRQTVNVAALKVRYNFKTSKWAILDTYERYYYPDFNIGEFQKYNINDAIDIYNQSESVRIHGLTTQQIKANRIGYNKIIGETFNTKEQEAFVRWLTKDSEYPIIVGNNIRFDALSINDAFVKYTGYNPTYLDLMDMAQSTPELISELARDKKLNGKGGLSVQRMYSRLMHDANYVEKHFGAYDVIDELSIFKALTERIRNSYNSHEGWDRLSSIIKENSPLTGKFVQYPWNVVPMQLEYNNSDVSVEFFEDIGMTSEDARNVYIKYKLGKYKPGTLGNVILHNLKINKEALVMNVLTRDIHKMTKKQRKEYKKELKRKKYKLLTGDKSVVETMTFEGDTLVSNGFINEDFVNYDDYEESDYEKAELNNVDEEDREHFISWDKKDRDAELSFDDEDNMTLYNAGSYRIDAEDIKKQRKRNKGYAKSVSHALYNAEEATEYNEETSVEDFSDKQFLESMVAEMNKYPSYRGKLYVVYTGSEYKIVSDDPVVAKQLETGTGTLDVLPDEEENNYRNKRTADKNYSKLYTEEDIFDEVMRRIHMKVESKWQERIMNLNRYKRKGLLSQDRYDRIMSEMSKYTTDEERLNYLDDNKLKSLIAPPVAYRTSAWQEAMEQIHNDVAVAQQKSLKFRQKLDRLVDSGYMTEDRAEYIYNQKRYYGASDSDINDMINQKQYEKDVQEYLANEDANAAAIREAEIRAASDSAAKEKALSDAYINRRNSEAYDKIHMREGLGDRIDYLVNHGKLSKGTADAILSQFDARVAAGTGSMEAFEKELNKATKEIDKNIVAQQKATKAWESMIKPTDFNAVYQAGYAQINGVLGAASGVLPNFVMSPMKRAGAAIINGFEVDRAKYNYYARTAGMIKNNLSVAGAIVGSFVPGLGAVPGMAIGAGVGEIGTSIYNQMMWRRERRINETGNIIQNSLNTVGFLKSISGLDIAFSALTKTVKWATLGFVGMVTKGLHSMQSLGNPITQLSGVGYSNYQVYGRMDRMFGFSNGTINSSIENFALQQRRMYTYGQMDIDRVVAASMLGVFGNVYANGGDPKKNYEETVNKIAAGGITDTKLSWAAMIDKTLPQILQIMKDMDARTLSDVYRQSGVTFNELTDEERKKMRRVSFGYRTSLSNISTSWQRMGAALWEGGLNKVFDRISTWIETLAQNAGVWMEKINPLIDAFDSLFNAFKSGNKGEIEAAMNSIKKAFGDILGVIREPLVKMVSGISVALMSAIQTMLPSISKMVQSLIGEISQFNFDKDALMSNINNGTNFPVIRYGEQKGQFRYLGNSEYERQKFDKIVNNDDLTTEQKKIQLGYAMPNAVFQKKKWVNTEDYKPLTAVSDANKAISGIANDVASGDLINKVMKAFMDAFEKAMKVDVTVTDVNTGNSSHGSVNENMSIGDWYTRIEVNE